MSEAAKPPIEVDPAALCPSCGRFVGPKRRCPHCGAGIHTRLSLRLFQGGGVLVALLGLFFLYLWARNRDITEVRIGEIVETMNMAYVRVEGTVGRVSSRRDEKGRMEDVRFDLDDGTGVAMVRAYRHVARSLEAQGIMPRRGDNASLAGSVRMDAEGRVTLTVQTADHVQVRVSESVHVPLADLSAALTGKIVEIEGKVVAVYAPPDGTRRPFRILLRDGEGDAALVVWQSNWPLLERKGLKPGATVLARVTVGEYRGKLQLQLENPEDLKIEAVGDALPQPPVRPPSEGALEPGAVNRSHLGTKITVAGTVKKVEPAPQNSRSPNTITIGGGGGLISVVLWGEGFEDLVKAGVEPGARVSVVGTVSEYRGMLQIKPGSEKDVSILHAVERAGIELPGVVAPGEVKRGWIGRTVTVKGSVSALHRKRSGILIILTGETGELEVFVAKNLESFIQDLGSLGQGGRIRVRGMVSEYEGKIQVNPHEAGDLVVEEGGLRIPQARKVSSLSTSDEGLLVVLTGKFTEVGAMAKGTKAVLDDGSGKTITVVIWDTVKSAVRDAETVLQAGRRVQVIGQVSSYRGELQIVPQAGWDVISKE